MSEDLAERLAADLRPCSPYLTPRRLLAGALGGALVSIAFVIVTMGARHDMARASGAFAFWLKFAYPLALAGVGLWATERLSRPGGAGLARAVWIVAPILLVATIAAGQLWRAPAAMREPMMMGHSALVCPWFILGVSAPPLAGLVWAARGLAPTRLTATGAVIGLVAGALGACAYALHCDESAVPFLTIWYSCGIAATALIGAASGRYLLRW